MVDILSFQGEHRWLSNFHPVKIKFDGLIFNSVEAAYVAAKTTDRTLREKISLLSSPGECKRFGRKLDIREDWEAVKVDAMRFFLKQKFTHNSFLGNKLLSTGSCQIVEGNTWGDTFWGVCNGKGDNTLGNLLMEIREELRHE